MELIEMKDYAAFRSYLHRTKNTICGQQPISVLLASVGYAEEESNLEIKFVFYAQSSPCVSMSDSSVSYAAGVVTVSGS